MQQAALRAAARARLASKLVNLQERAQRQDGLAGWTAAIPELRCDDSTCLLQGAALNLADAPTAERLMSESAKSRWSKRSSSFAASVD